MAQYTRTIKFRVEKHMYDFIKSIADQKNMTVSEVVRNIITYHILMALVEQPVPLSELRKKALDMLREEEKLLEEQKSQQV